MNLLKVVPDTVINDNFSVHDEKILDLLEKIYPNEVFTNLVEDNDDIFDTQTAIQQSAFLQVVTETIFEYPHNSYSEKTWRPIVNLRPFVIVGVPGSLDNLKDLGFKTFNKWWNESYDNLVDSIDRLLAIVDIIEYIANKPTHKLQKFLIDMHPVLMHNRNHYYNEFRANGIDQIHKKCQQNLLPR